MLKINIRTRANIPAKMNHRCSRNVLISLVSKKGRRIKMAKMTKGINTPMVGGTSFMTWNNQRKYHSGLMVEGVTNGFASSSNPIGKMTERVTTIPMMNRKMIISVKNWSG
jgi:hypothetical protein